MRHGSGNSEAAGNSGVCDCHVDSGAESPKDSVRLFAALAFAARLVLDTADNGICSVDIIVQKLPPSCPKKAYHCAPVVHEDRHIHLHTPSLKNTGYK